MNGAILIVEDNASIRDLIEEFLCYLVDAEQVRIFKTDKESEAEEILKREKVSLLITDVNLGRGGDGLSIVNSLKEAPRRPYIIAISSIEWLEKIRNYLTNGTVDTFLSKPFSFKELKSKVQDSQAVILKL